MITFSKLGKKGNLGNHLFHIASTIGLAKEHNQSYCFPEWVYEDNFDFEFPKLTENTEFHYLKEQHYHHYDWELRNKNYDIEGWLQSEKYFDIQFTKEMFQFKKELIEDLKRRYNYIFDKPTILITVRRGDFIHHPHYFQLSYKYYFLALIENFENWQHYNLIFTSDEIDYCKFHFSHLPNAHFIHDLNAIEQLAFSTLADNYIISNSTFSWWVAWLGESSNSKIIRPFKKFRGEKSTMSDEKDFFPNRWIIFNHKSKNIPIKYYKLITKGQIYLFGKFIYNKLRGMKYRIIRLLKN